MAEDLNVTAETDDRPEAEQDESDAKSWLASLVEDKDRSEKAINVQVEKDAEEYNMNHKYRGKAVIFNHKDFTVDQLNSRKGTDTDRDNLAKVLKGLDFEVEVFNDLTRDKVFARLSDLADEDHSERDCLIVCVFSHGIENQIYARDGSYKSENLWNGFTADRCPTLAGKPKIFLIQACQGDKLESGVTLRNSSKAFQFSHVDSIGDVPDSRAQSTSYKIPNRADFLMAFSSFPGYYSWRNQTQGSWFIQSVCKVFQNQGRHKELQAMMTAVARNVALNFESFVPNNQEMDQKRQMPYITTTLIRECYFRPKRNPGMSEDVVDNAEVTEEKPNFRQARFSLVNPAPAPTKSFVEVAPDSTIPLAKHKETSDPKARFSLVRPTDKVSGKDSNDQK